MSEKKMVRRNVAIALGIICIVSLAELLMALAYFMPIINDKNAQNIRLSSRNANLQSRIDEFASILNLDKSIVLSVSNNTLILPHSYAIILSSLDSPPYAGYISIEVSESTSPTTYIEVIFFSRGVSYHNKVVIGTNGTELFPVLPSLIITIRVGADSANIETVNRITLTYYY